MPRPVLAWLLGSLWPSSVYSRTPLQSPLVGWSISLAPPFIRLHTTRSETCRCSACLERVKGHLNLSVCLNLDLSLNSGCPWGGAEETVQRWRTLSYRAQRGHGPQLGWSQKSWPDSMACSLECTACSSKRRMPAPWGFPVITVKLGLWPEHTAFWTYNLDTDTVHCMGGIWLNIHGMGQVVFLT